MSLYYSVSQKFRVAGPQEHYRHRQGKRRRKQAMAAQRAAPRLPKLEEIADHERLLDAWKHLSRKGGQAPGPDGLSYDDFSFREIASVMRTVSPAIIKRRYRAGGYRSVSVRKSSGKGNRKLQLRNIVDRSVAKACHLGIEPYWETVFLDCSFGFRPKRNTWQLLVDLEMTMMKKDRYVLLVDDIANAFDHVRLSDLIQMHREHGAEDGLLYLLDAIYNDKGLKDVVGIDQGSPFSPTGLNICLHHLHDIRVEAIAAFPPWWRYADNLAYLCKDESEAVGVREKVQSLLRKGGLQLKMEDPAVDLRKGAIQLLGFTVRQENDRLVYELGAKAWAKLANDLLGAHEMPDPPRTALGVIKGWMQAMGPAFPALSNDQAVDILSFLENFGFDLSFHVGVGVLRGWAAKTHRQWSATRSSLMPTCG